ncbi:uncharacterized protein V1510DRAFT_409326 [Dipodascopsis tothii]|uniref:uncharacterized protein n=1 Tax=Dipodascopsis tothii TaxID=44089 RepID=UPI0034CDEF7B
MATAHPLKIAVVGCTGFSGRHITIELVNRGHDVTGISRSPVNIGKAANFSPLALDVVQTPTSNLGDVFANFDVIINAFGPHTGSDFSYMTYLESIRKIVMAVKVATSDKRPYMINIGGTGSLIVKSLGINVVDHDAFWIQYVRSIAQSEVHVHYFKEIIPQLGDMLQNYRNAIMATKHSKPTPDQLAYIKEYEVMAAGFDHDFIRACRTSFMFFEGNRSFDWTFISPPAMYCPGKRTGSYIAHSSGFLPEPKNADDLLPGIAASDLAIAIADEAETRERMFLHWTATADQSDDSVVPTYPSL